MRYFLAAVLVVCSAGWFCTMSSYGRYQELASCLTPMAQYWPLWAPAYSGPYLACGALAFLARRRRGILFAAACVTLLIASLWVWDFATPVDEYQHRPEFHAGLQLFCAAVAQYLVVFLFGLPAFLFLLGTAVSDATVQGSSAAAGVIVRPGRI